MSPHENNEVEVQPRRAPPPPPPPPPQDTDDENVPDSSAVTISSVQAPEGIGTGDSEEERPKPGDALTLAVACSVLLINIPALGTLESRHLILYYVHIILLGLALLLSIGLYVFSICDDDDGSSSGDGGSRRVMKAWWKRTTMAAAVFLVAATIMLRVVITLPVATTKYVLPLFLGGAVLVLGTLYCLLRKRAEASTTGQLSMAAILMIATIVVSIF